MNSFICSLHNDEYGKLSTKYYSIFIVSLMNHIHLSLKMSQIANNDLVILSHYGSRVSFVEWEGVIFLGIKFKLC